MAILSHYELSVNELVQVLGIPQSRVSRHLKILVEAGFLQSRREGLWAFYSSTSNGANANFLNAITPFFSESPHSQTDMTLAGRMLEERATRAKLFFNTIAEKWDDLNREILGDFNLPAEILKAMPPICDVAVDLGCGTGAVLASLMEGAGEVIGVDGSSAMLDICRNRLVRAAGSNNNVSLRIGELSHLPLANNEANFACINLVLHHVPDPRAVLAEIHRILDQKGILFIADFLKHNDETMRSRYGDHWLGFESSTLDHYLEEEGFAARHREIQPVGRGLKLILLTAQLPPTIKPETFGNDKTT